MTSARYVVQTDSEARRLVAASRRVGMNAQTDGLDGTTPGGHTVDVWGEILDDAALDELVARTAPEAVREPS